MVKNNAAVWSQAMIDWMKYIMLLHHGLGLLQMQTVMKLSDGTMVSVELHNMSTMIALADQAKSLADIGYNRSRNQ